MYRVCLVDTATWRRKMDITPKSGSWGRAQNAGRSGQCVLQAGDQSDPDAVIRSTTWPLLHFVVVEWLTSPLAAPVILYAGIVTDTEYSWKSKDVTLSHADIWWLFTRRFVLKDRTSTFATKPSKFVYVNIDAATLAKMGIQGGTNGGSDPQYVLPIVLPANGTGTIDRTIYGYDLETVQDILDEAIQAEGGIDIDFRPRWSTEGTLEWVMDVNANKTTVLDWDLDAEETPVTDFNFRVAGSGVGNVVYGVGEGMEVDMKVHAAKTAGSVYLALERQVAFKSVKNADALRRRTLGEMVPTNGAIRQIDMSVQADGPPHVGQFKLGSTIRWKADNDPWLLAGWSGDWELLEFSGAMTSPSVKLAFQGREGD